ncbi:MAG: gliding motility-associated C-terminal domain-containing protein [Bacteroidota bacterium]|jgi:gliding motility-associated-like protein
MKSLNKSILMVVLTLIVAGSSTAQDTRKYRVTAYKNGNNGISSLSNTVEVVPYMNIYLPNSFTPNGDGLNDTFGAIGEAIGEYTMQVFNRWGQLVFESTSYKNQWDGRYEGEPVPTGLYVYKMRAKGKAGNLTQKEGTVTVVY